MTDQDRTKLIGNIVDHLGGAQKRIQLRQTALFFKAILITAGALPKDWG